MFFDESTPALPYPDKPIGVNKENPGQQSQTGGNGYSGMT